MAVFNLGGSLYSGEGIDEQENGNIFLENQIDKRTEKSIEARLCGIIWRFPEVCYNTGPYTSFPDLGNGNPG